LGVLDFHDELIKEIETFSVPPGIRNETDFEKGFLIPCVRKMSARYTDLNTYIHPWNNKTCCEPDCETATNSGRIVAGCPKCWAASKKWASVLAFGTNHTFDAVTKDKISGKTLVVEAKFITSRGGRMPNGEIQRLLGQCLLAKTKHDFVIGLCGRKGSLDSRWNDDTEAVTNWSKRAGIDIVFRSID
jgi:hypothetical protein